MRNTRLDPLAMLALLTPLELAGCSAAPEWEWKTPPSVDEAALVELLRPREGERLVMANFWATW